MTRQQDSRSYWRIAAGQPDALGMGAAACLARGDLSPKVLETAIRQAIRRSPLTMTAANDQRIVPGTPIVRAVMVEHIGGVA